MRIVVIAIVLAGCRIGFDHIGGDAMSDTLSTSRISFGERASSQVTGVTRDATLVEQRPNNNAGALEDLGIEDDAGFRMHTLIRFELGSIAGMQVIAAELQLTRVDYGDEIAGTVEARVVTQSWVEGTLKNGMGAGATWASRDLGLPWTTPGGSRAAPVVGVATPSAPGVILVITPAVIQSWIDDPPNNAGLLISSVFPAHYHFEARESLTPALRPELVLALP